MTARPAVLVVVVSYRTAALLPVLLESVLGEAAVQEVVVRDNSAGADAIELAEVRARFPLVRFILGANVGFGAGVNAAVDAATSAWTDVWVLNPDARVRPGALDELLSVAAREGFGVVSPLILTPGDVDVDRIWYAGGELDLLRGRSTHGGAGRPADTVGGSPRRVTFVTGAAPLLTRGAWERLGGFSERFFLYWEDADLSLRAAGLGVSLGFVPTAVVDHWQGGASGGGASPVYCYYVQRNRLWLDGDFRRRVDLAFGRGARVTLDHLLQPIRRSSRSSTPVRSLWASLRGLLAGLAGAPSARESRAAVPR